MRKILTLASFLFICFTTVKSEKPTIIHGVLNDYVVQKVDEMQQLIKFSDTQAGQLKKLELQFLLDVQKAESCLFCNTKKRIDKLKQNRDVDLQQILTREQFLKYEALINKQIKNIPLRS